MPKKNLTQQFVESTKSSPRGKAKIDYYDTKVTGLVLKVLASGKRSYYLRYRADRGHQVEKKLANAEIVPLADIRALAKSHLAEIALGRDPYAEREARKDVPTLRHFIEHEYLPYARSYKKSWKNDWGQLKAHVLEPLGDLYLDEVTPARIMKVVRRHRETHKPSSSNKLIILLRFIFNCALRWKTPGVKENPTAVIELYVENNARERFLSPEETQRLIDVLETAKPPMLKWIVMFLLFTGARRGEVLNARWEDIDLRRQIWTIPINKSGKTRHVYLSPQALFVLKALNEAGRVSGDYPFGNPETQKPYVSIFKRWHEVRCRAGLPGLRMHDLRHSFASFMVNAGRSLYEVQRLLGHRDITTTQRYAHLTQASLIDAASSVPWQPTDAPETPHTGEAVLRGKGSTAAKT
ncbi:MAG TPA: integrase [Halomonas campaniensis]|uniref:Integrase n=1 Tax=Halomonas campaniensis TaxID=213554 RepID=A0A3D0KJX8_9GAMM|nr:site-specific integrase [Halomonas sp. 3F2F]HCA03665.1 integrase [Halomonas campaniensis]